VHSADVMSYALRRGVDRSDAEDVVVETFLICWRRLDDVPNPPLPWLLGVARRVIANQRRAKGRRLALHKKVAMSLLRIPTAASDPPSDSHVLREALSSLREEDRDVLALVAWHGLTHEAAATVMGCTRNALTKRYLRARHNLRAQLPLDWSYDEDDDKRCPTRGLRRVKS
jgi:RNA polymerase sigma-70 factor (ECF subfamily)